MTVKELKQYRSICREIEEKSIELNDKSVAGIVRGSMKEFPFAQRSFTVGGADGSVANTKLLEKINALEEQKQHIENYISSIEDSVTRRIFEYRYLKGSKRVSWQEIAFKIGEHDESYPRRKHNKFLKLAENAENNVVKC